MLALYQLFFFFGKRSACIFLRPTGATVRTFGIIFFFLSWASQNAPTGHEPHKYRFLFGKSTISEMHVLVFSVLIDQSGKISENRPAMAREDTER